MWRACSIVSVIAGAVSLACAQSTSTAPAPAATTPASAPAAAPTTTAPASTPATTPATTPASAPASAPATAPATVSRPATAPATMPATVPATAPTTAPVTQPATTTSRPATRAAAPIVPVPVPPDAKLQAAAKDVRSVYKEEYAKVTPADRLALGRKLFAEGIDNEPAIQYYMLSEAISYTSNGGDFVTAMEATRALTARFLVDEKKFRSTTLENLARAAGTQQIRLLILTTRQFLVLAEECMKAEAYADASKYALRGATFARELRDPQLMRRSEQALAAARLGENDLERANSARAALARTPDDQLANTTLGKYLCFVRRDFAAGVPMLAKGFDPEYKAIAQAEIKAAKNPVELLAAADAWWDLAGKLQRTDAAHGAIRSHVHAIYFDALTLDTENKIGVVARAMANNRRLAVEADGDVSEEIKIISAAWGIARKRGEEIVIERGVDAGPIMKAMFRYEGTTIVQASASYLGDHLPGQGKTLQLTYTYHGQTLVDNIGEGYLLNYPPLPNDGMTVPTKEFRIVEAYWGHGNNWQDITVKLRQIIRTNAITIKPNAKTLLLTETDRTSKHLVVIYELNEKRFFKSVAQDQNLTLDGK